MNGGHRQEGVQDGQPMCVERQVHERFTKLMSLCLDGEATSSEQLELQRHLTECPECSRTWVRWHALHKLLLATPSATPRRDLIVGASRLEGERVHEECRLGCLLAAAILVGALVLVRNCVAAVSLLRLAWPQLSNIVTSASLSVEVFSRHFWSTDGAPSPSVIVSASGLAFLIVLSLTITGALAALMKCVRRDAH
jgi:anti-sigma factor RsiW